MTIAIDRCAGLLLGPSFLLAPLGCGEEPEPAADRAAPVRPAPPTRDEEPAVDDDTSELSMSAYERIQLAAAAGQLSAREAVLLSARLLFAPGTLPDDSEFRPRPGEAVFRDEGLTGFYKEVHRVFQDLDAVDRDLLASLSPDLQAIIAQRTLDSDRD